MSKISQESFLQIEGKGQSVTETVSVSVETKISPVDISKVGPTAVNSAYTFNSREELERFIQGHISKKPFYWLNPANGQLSLVNFERKNSCYLNGEQSEFNKEEKLASYEVLKNLYELISVDPKKLEALSKFGNIHASMEAMFNHFDPESTSEEAIAKNQNAPSISIEATLNNMVVKAGFMNGNDPDGAKILVDFGDIRFTLGVDSHDVV